MPVKGKTPWKWGGAGDEARAAAGISRRRGPVRGRASPGRSGPGVRRAYVARSERPQRFGPYVEQRGDWSSRNLPA